MAKRTKKVKEAPKIERHFGLEAEETLAKALIENVEASRDPSPELLAQIQKHLKEAATIDEVKVVKRSIDTSHPLKELISEYASKVGVEKATKLAQKLLHIGESGVYNETTESAYDFLSNKTDFANDYRNLQK